MKKIYTKQAGVATLFTALIFLLISTLMVLYSNKSIFGQQRASTQLYTKIQATETAESAISQFIAEVQRNPGTFLDSSFALATNNTQTNGIPNTTTIHLRLTRPDSTNTAALIYASNISTMKIRLLSLGYSDCNSISGSSTKSQLESNCQAKSQIIQDIDLSQIGLRNALTVQCNMTTNGSTHIVLDRKASSPYPPALAGYAIETGSTPNISGSKNSQNIGDSSKNENVDANLCTMNKDDYFKSFFNKSPADILNTSTALRPSHANFANSPVKRISASEFAAACQDSSSFLRDPAKLVGAPIIWVDGSIDGGPSKAITLGSMGTSMTGCKVGSDQSSTGGPIRPAKVIFDGDATIYGAMDIIGFMYGRGTGASWTHSQTGSLAIYGAAAFEGSYNGSHGFGMTLSVYAQEKFLNPLGMSGGVIPSKTKWRDF
jgi:Tfp pilus assembly protein PilX